MADYAGFSLVWHGISSDEKFAEVYADNDLLACWLRLLIAADKAWPEAASIPFDTDLGSVDRLVKLTLIDELPHHHFRVHGMAAERERRSERYRRAANKRHHPEGE